MTTLKKLSIQGVRSYSDGAPEVIEFFHPLTLIVGANGSGKTTVIEALKFACTGSQPPLSDGGKSFVHDPKVVGTSVVKAQIKLAIKTLDNKPILAIRSFQLTQKKAKREFKQVESVLRTVNSQGEEVSISHRCSDIDKQVPQLMGVSKAVLEHVIFCHQEDSLWPLSDSKSLKLKFDEIFDATRYTKALESIRKLKLEKTQEIKEMDGHLVATSTRMEQAHKLSDDIGEVSKKIQVKTSKMSEIDVEMKQIQARLDELGARAQQLSKIKIEVKRLESQKEVMVSEQKKAHEQLENEYEGYRHIDSDEELQQLYKKFLAEMEAARGIVQAKQEALQSGQRHVKAKSDEYQELTKQLGKLEALSGQYNKNKTDLELMANKLASQLELGGAALTTFRSSKDYSVFGSKLEDALRSRTEKLQRHKQHALEVDNGFESTLNSLKKKESQIGEKLTSTQDRLRDNADRLKRVSEGLQSTQQKMGSLADITPAIQKAEEELKQFNAKDATEAIKSKIELKNKQLRTNVAHRNDLSKHRKELAVQQERMTQLKLNREHLEKAKKTHNQALDKMLGAMGEWAPKDFLPLPAEEELGSALSNPRYNSPSLELNVKKRMENAAESTKRANEVLMSAQSKAAAVDGQIKAMQSRLEDVDAALTHQRTEFERNGLIKMIEGAGRDVEEELKIMEKKVEKLKAEKQMNSSATFLYKKFIGLAQESHSCPFCVRGLDDNELSTLVRVNEEKIERVKSENLVGVISENITRAETKLEKMKKVKEKLSEHTKVQKERSTLAEEYKALQTTREKLTPEVENAQKQYSNAKHMEETTRQLYSLSVELSRLWTETRSKFKVVEADGSRLQTQGGRNLDQIQKEFEDLEGQHFELNKELGVLQEQLEAVRTQRDILQAKTTSLRESRMELSRLEVNRERLQAEKKDIANENARLNEDLQKLQGEVGPVKQSIRESAQERHDARTKNNKQEEGFLVQVSDAQRAVDNYNTLLTAITEYERNAPQRSDMEGGVQRSKREIEALQQQLHNLREEVQAKEKDLANQKAVDADIRANIEYRNRCKALIAHQKMIDEQKAVLREYLKDGDVEADIGDFKDDLAKMKTAQDELRGAIITERQQVQVWKDELASPVYKNIDLKYKDLVVVKKTTEIAVSDLDTYYKALDAAMMEYHSVKMKAINEVLKEYWRTTYRGKDIDEVYIRSEPAESKAGKRTYNYRVVMRQGDTELDMRGRCSAGQKVLACLLIRLALADTFCLSCGVLALDEPTTNLDSANTMSFARALCDIINKRRGQKNFQLVLITHDEKFMELIGRRSNTDFYYRIYKNINNCTVIRKMRAERLEE